MIAMLAGCRAIDDAVQAAAIRRAAAARAFGRASAVCAWRKIRAQEGAGR